VNTFSTSPAIAAIIARLVLADSPFDNGHEAFDGGPTTTPSKPYFCVWDQTATTRRGKYSGDPQRLYLPFQVSCVARTRAGLRDAVQLARSALLMWTPVKGASLIVEDGSNPILSEGTGNDIRLTAPLTLHCYLPKET